MSPTHRNLPGARSDTQSIPENPPATPDRARAATPPPEKPGVGTSAFSLGRRDVAAIFHVSSSTVTRWAREGKIPASRTPGGHYRYSGAVRDLGGG